MVKNMKQISVHNVKWLGDSNGQISFDSRNILLRRGQLLPFSFSTAIITAQLLL